MIATPHKKKSKVECQRRPAVARLVDAWLMHVMIRKAFRVSLMRFLSSLASQSTKSKEKLSQQIQVHKQLESPSGESVAIECAQLTVAMVVQTSPANRTLVPVSS